MYPNACRFNYCMYKRFQQSFRVTLNTNNSKIFFILALPTTPLSLQANSLSNQLAYRSCWCFLASPPSFLCNLLLSIALTLSLAADKTPSEARRIGGQLERLVRLFILNSIRYQVPLTTPKPLWLFP